MYDPIPVRTLIVHTDGRTIPIFFKQANLLLNAPGPNNLKEWAVEAEEIDSESAERLEDLFHSVKTCTIHIETMNRFSLEGKIRIDQIAVGPHAHARFKGVGLLSGFERLV